MSAAITAAAATVYAQFIYQIDPFYVVHIRLSILILLPAVRLGTVWGPVVGAALLVPIEQFAQRELGGTYAGGQLVLYGLVVILVLRFLPEGIVGVVGRAYEALLAQLPGYRALER